jgi:hypothetical protein
LGPCHYRSPDFNVKAAETQTGPAGHSETGEQGRILRCVKCHASDGVDGSATGTGKDRLGSISKQGDRYLRSLFTAGALAVIRFAKIHGTKHRPKNSGGSRVCSSDARTGHTDQGPNRSVEFHRGSSAAPRLFRHLVGSHRRNLNSMARIKVGFLRPPSPSIVFTLDCPTCLSNHFGPGPRI